MGSATRMGPNGRIVESAATARARMRQEASILREDLAIKLYAQGCTMDAIAKAMELEFGVKLRGQLLGLIRRGLYRRTVANEGYADTAREMLLAQYRELLEVYTPRALGLAGDEGEEGEAVAPDLRAADLVLKVLDKVGQVTGALSPPRAGDINLNIITPAPDEAEKIRATVAARVAAERAKQVTIDGELLTSPKASAADADERRLPPFPLGPAPS